MGKIQASIRYESMWNQEYCLKTYDQEIKQNSTLKVLAFRLSSILYFADP